MALICTFGVARQAVANPVMQNGFPSLPLAAFCCGLCVQFTGDPNLGVSSYLHCPLPSQTKDFQVEARALTMEAIAFTAQPWRVIVNSNSQTDSDLCKNYPNPF